MISTKNTKRAQRILRAFFVFLVDEIFGKLEWKKMSINSFTKNTKRTQRILRAFFVFLVDEIFSGEPQARLRVRNTETLGT